MAAMIVSKLMQRPEKLVIFSMDPMRAMAFLPFVLWELARSMTFLDVAINLISQLMVEKTFISLREENKRVN
jgi:hypothetical protein